ncbi:hypothetical protein IWW34DRAFT_620072, partial [Fusarium oxysporum f. sp. albedinis]
TSCSIGNAWKDHILFQGICAPETSTTPAVNLGLNLPSCQITGDIGFACGADFLTTPNVRVGLGGISAYIEIDLSASAAVHQSVELFAAPKLGIAIPGLDAELKAAIEAAIAIDLVVGCGKAIDLSAGVYVKFPESAYVDISLLTKEVIHASLEGLVTKALPVGVGADVELGAGIDLQLGLRLRSELSIGDGLEIPVLGLGGKAGADVGFGAGVWFSLFDYTATIGGGAGASAGIDVTGEFGCNLGLAIDKKFDFSGGLFGLIPNLSVGLAKGIKSTFSQKTHGTCGSFIGHFKKGGFIGGPTISASGAITATGGASADITIPAGAPAATASGDVTGSAELPETSAPAVTAAPDASGMITSTIRETHVYTITSCAASVINCPASYTQKIVTQTVIERTTVCPATATAGSDNGNNGSAPAPTSPPDAAKTTIDLVTITQDVTTIVPCTKFVTSTFVAPTTVHAPAAPTVTIIQGHTGQAPQETGTQQPGAFTTLTRVPATATDSGASPTEGSEQPANPQAPGNAGPGAQPTYNVPSNGTIPGGKPSPTDQVPVVAGASLVSAGSMLLALPMALAFVM